MNKIKRWKRKSYFANAFYQNLVKYNDDRYFWFYEMAIYYDEKLFQAGYFKYNK